MTAAAARSPRWATSLDPRRHAGGGRGGREAARPRHARLRARRARDGRRRRGPGDDGRARRRAAGDGDRARRAPAGGERRVRERDALPRARLRRHALRLGQPRLDGRSRPAALAAGEALGSHGRDVLAAIVAGNEVVCRVGMAASGRVPRARLPPDGDLRRLRRRRPRSRASSGLDAETTTRALGIAGSFAGGLFAYLADGHADEADASRLGGARRSPRGAARARTARPGRSRCSRGSSASTTRSSARSEGEIDIAGQLADLGSALGDAADRVQAVPRVPLHARLARRGRRGASQGGRFAPDEIAEVGRHRPGGGRLARARAGRSRSRRRARSTRASSPCSTRSHRCSSAATSACRDFTDEAIADPERARRRRARCATRRRDYPTYPQAFPGGVGVRLADGTTLEADFPYQQGGPENPLSHAEVRAKFRENAALVLSDDAVDALEEAILALDERDDLRAALAPLTLARGRPRMTCSPREQREIVAAVRDVRRPGRDPGRLRARARATSTPSRARRDDARDGPLRDDDPRGVRRARARARHVRADRDGALARLGDAVRDPQRLVHRRDDDPPARDGGAARALPAAGWRSWRSARRSR